ncbi:MAG: hypothetical protein PHH57_07125 [Candidatus Omnitrophica bacterium]|jgi:hypothetical protein|nr:hypothetical protein [Candidatus Omnitrophota bacterium]
MAHKRKWEITKEEEIPLEKKDCLSTAELDLLCELERKVPPQHVVVEVANKTYESTEALITGNQLGRTRVFNLALYGKDHSTPKAAKTNSDTRLQDEIKEAETTNCATILNESAYDLSRRWRETIGLLIVIGYQNSEEIREAVVCWQGYLSADITVVIHNCHEPGPAKAIKEFLTDGGNFILYREVGNMTALVMDRCQHHWTINSSEIGICHNCGRKRNFRRLNREATNLGIRKRTSHRLR